MGQLETILIIFHIQYVIYKIRMQQRVTACRWSHVKYHTQMMTVRPLSSTIRVVALISLVMLIPEKLMRC